MSNVEEIFWTYRELHGPGSLSNIAQHCHHRLGYFVVTGAYTLQFNSARLVRALVHAISERLLQMLLQSLQ